MTFIFDSYSFDEVTGVASFRYRFSDGQTFTERVALTVSSAYDARVLDRALFLAFVVIGTSYFKAFPTPDVQFASHVIDSGQAAFLNAVYQDGLGQYAYENHLTRADLAQFAPTGQAQLATPYDGSGVISLQSGGKDSLLVASLLGKKGQDFTSLYISSTQEYPAVIDAIGKPVRLVGRTIDLEALRAAAQRGGKNGHVPVTFIVQAIALLQMILDNKSTVLSAIGHEGEEPHAMIGDLAVTHQWSKTWRAEQLFADYVTRYISPDITIGSPLRSYSELRISELFVQHAWPAFGTSFSSCNVANYAQGAQNSELTWCGNCPKCANAYLLFAPFVPSRELQARFGGRDLFTQPALASTFQGLLGIDGAFKPFECVGEVDELRSAYHMAQRTGDYGALPFAVPASTFDRMATYPAQVIQL